jgi:vacuolar-type H+-ATPase subunit E/Vma4
MSSGLETIVDEIIKDSMAKAELAKRQNQLELEEAIETARKEAIRDADKVVRNAEAEAAAAGIRRASQERQKARLAYLTAKNRTVQDVMDRVRARLAELVQDESTYRPFLLKMIARGLEAVPSEHVKVALSKRDLDRFNGTKLLAEAIATTKMKKKVTLSDQPVETIGGALITSEDGRIGADCTFEARLQLMEPEILPEISKILFAT